MLPIWYMNYYCKIAENCRTISLITNMGDSIVIFWVCVNIWFEEYIAYHQSNKLR